MSIPAMIGIPMGTKVVVRMCQGITSSVSGYIEELRIIVLLSNSFCSMLVSVLLLCLSSFTLWEYATRVWFI